MLKKTKVKIPIVDLAQQFKETNKNILKRWQKVLRKGVFISGPNTRAFESSFARFTRSKYSKSVASGTDALRLALTAAGIGKNDEVITPSFTFVASAMVIAQLQAKPVFVDIDEETYNINSQKIEPAITKKTKAILPVHLFGQPANMTDILKIAKTYKLKVIEDSAQAHGATLGGKPAGSLGDIAAFSFYPTKNLGSFSDAGMVTTNNKDYFKHLQKLSNYGFDPRYFSHELGFNSRIDELQAVWLLAYLKHLKTWNTRRRSLAKRYLSLLKDLPIKLPAEKEGFYHVYHIFAILTPNRDKLQKFLSSKGITTLVHYPFPIHVQPAFKYLKTKKLPESEKVAKQILSLPIYPQLSHKNQDYICYCIKDFYQKNGR